MRKIANIALVLFLAVSLLPTVSVPAAAMSYEVILEPTYAGGSNSPSGVSSTYYEFVPRPFWKGYSIVFENVEARPGAYKDYYAKSSFVVDKNGNKVDLGDYDMFGTWSFNDLYLPQYGGYSVDAESPSVDKYGYINVYKNGMHGLIDTSGKVILPCKYAEIWVRGRDLFEVSDSPDGEKYYIGDIAAKDNTFFSAKKYTGKYIMFAEYNYAEYAYAISGLAVVAQGFGEKTTRDLGEGRIVESYEYYKYGIVDETDNIIVPFIYDDITLCFDDTSWVLSDGKWGIIRITNGSASTESPAPAPSVAVPTSSKVFVNGEQVSFDSYNINDNNYFKLRDLAYVLSGTEKQFEVSWDGANNAISLTGGQPYTSVGGEMQSGGTGSKSVAATTSKILLDGKEVKFAAYNIEDNNYFKLRDIGEAFDFGVDWDGANNAIIIDTSKGYTAG